MASENIGCFSEARKAANIAFLADTNIASARKAISIFVFTAKATYYVKYCSKHNKCSKGVVEKDNFNFKQQQFKADMPYEHSQKNAET